MLKKGESGKVFRVGSGGFDMSSKTSLLLTFEKPDETVVTKIPSLGASPVTDPDIGSLSANEYVEYEIEPGFLDQAGTWSVYLTYTDTVPDPDDIYIGDTVQFTVQDVTF